MTRAPNDEQARKAATADDAVLDRLAVLEADALDALEDSDEHIRRAAENALIVVAEIRHYVRCGDLVVTLAMDAALDTGLLWGVLRRRHHVRAAVAVERADMMLELWPHTVRGRTVLRGSAKAGEMKRGKVKGPSNEALRAQVEARHRKSGTASWTAVCERVARDNGLKCGRTVRRRVPDTRW